MFEDCNVEEYVADQEYCLSEKVRITEGAGV